jgi:uncharacterized protein (TIGR01244 family)
MRMLIAAAAVVLAGNLTAQSTPAGVSNYTRVDATVACAGATPVEAIPALKADGFRSIVNLRQASEEGANVDASRQAAEAAGLRYVHIPVDGANLKAESVDQFLAAMKDPRNSPAFIHCASANRVGMMWLIKRVVSDGWSVEKATAEAERVGLKSPRLKEFAIEYLKARGKA